MFKRKFPCLYCGANAAVKTSNEGDFKCNNCGKEWYSVEDDSTYTENDEEERLSIDEAIDCWLSHGKDEDYTCGYSEEELEGAINNY